MLMNTQLSLRRSEFKTELRPAPRAVTIGLINNMADEALHITERQFTSLISASAGDINVTLRLFALNRTPRSPSALEYLRTHCEPVSSAIGCKLDALIITGAQPCTARLEDEPYWQELTEIFDWAKENTSSTILSCLAAHAGVLYLDGIERRRLKEKCFGLFYFTVQHYHPLVGRRGNRRLTPHSRYNEVLQGELERAGYEILTSSPEHGVDIFTKFFGSQFVFLQGHPEYSANTLAREYRRDIGRESRGEIGRAPKMPEGYFSIDAEAESLALQRRVREGRCRLTSEELSRIDALAPVRPEWRDAAVSFYRHWIETIAASPHQKPTDAREAEPLASRDEF
jgi:homoserine O-succinyltransferase